MSGAVNVSCSGVHAGIPMPPDKETVMAWHVLSMRMWESSIEFLQCPRCGSALEMDALRLDDGISEGIMQCTGCVLQFPVVGGIPILWDDPAEYLSCRRILGGRLHRLASAPRLKEFLKGCLSGNAKPGPDRTEHEDRWAEIYQCSMDSEFYSVLKKRLESIPSSGCALEHGCSIGIMASHLAESHDVVFGVDRSFSALLHARRNRRRNLDYVAADSLSPVFGKKFDLVVALNMLDIVEPLDLLGHISGQIACGSVVISDPYDFDRTAPPGQKIDAAALRAELERLGFAISPDTREPSYIPWHLRISERVAMQYMADLAVGSRAACRRYAT